MAVSVLLKQERVRVSKEERGWTLQVVEVHF